MQPGQPAADRCMSNSGLCRFFFFSFFSPKYFKPPSWPSLFLLFSLSLLPPPVSDSPPFSSAKLEEWSAKNGSNLPPASSPLVSGMDKPHLVPEAKYTQVKRGHVSFIYLFIFCDLQSWLPAIRPLTQCRVEDLSSLIIRWSGNFSSQRSFCRLGYNGAFIDYLITHFGITTDTSCLVSSVYG